MSPQAAGAVRRVLVPHAIGGPPLPPLGARVRIGRLDGGTMGTTWRVRLVLGERDPLEPHRAAVEARLAVLIGALSNWEPDSALSRFNRWPVGTGQTLPRTLVDGLVAARDVHAASEGAFDPTVGRAVSAWGFGPPIDDRDLPLVADFAAIEIDAEGLRARRRAEVLVDLCGIAKGYAVDDLSRLLAARGCPHHLVEIGGELRGSGVKPDGLPWWVDLESPPDHDVREAPLVAALHGLSIATSGDYRRVVERGGRRHAHTIDPRTMRPVEEAAASVTVLHAACMRADAEATAITVLGIERGLAYATHRGLAARIVERRDTGLVAHHSPGFEAMLA